MLNIIARDHYFVYLRSGKEACDIAIDGLSAQAIFSRSCHIAERIYYYQEEQFFGTKLPI